jgi:hypothetical protein
VCVCLCVRVHMFMCMRECVRVWVCVSVYVYALRLLYFHTRHTFSDCISSYPGAGFCMCAFAALRTQGKRGKKTHLSSISKKLMQCIFEVVCDHGIILNMQEQRSRSLFISVNDFRMNFGCYKMLYFCYMLLYRMLWVRLLRPPRPPQSVV